MNEWRLAPRSRDAGRLARAIVVVAFAAATPSLPGCEPEVIVVPGNVLKLDVAVRLLPLPEQIRSSLGSFDVEVLRNDEVALTSALAFNPDTSELTVVGDDLLIPAGGRVAVVLTGRTITGSEAGVAGASTPIDLNAFDGASRVDVQVFVGPTGRFSQPPQQLVHARFGHSTTPLSDGGLLVMGGVDDGDVDAPTSLAPAPEWLHPLRGQGCAADDVGDTGCSFGAVPPPRAGHVAVAVDDVFDASCPVRGVVVAGGADRSGARDDAFVFDVRELFGAGAFVALPSLPHARTRGVAVALADCRVLFVGGAADDGGVLAIDELDLSGGVQGAVVRTIGELPAAMIDPTLLATNNAQSDVVVAGGVDDAGLPTARAVWLTRAGGGVAVCASDDGACVGDVQPLSCARAGAAGVVLDDGTDFSSSLVVGGLVDAACAATTSAERARLELEAPYVRFFAAPAPPVAFGRGVTLTALPAGRALVVGGLDDVAAPRGDVALFSLPSPLSPTGDDAGTFVASGALQTPTAFHTAVFSGGAVVVVGGRADDGATARVEIYLAGAP
jgi:hypothetical protein